VLSGRGSLRRAYHSSRGVLPTVVCSCVWSRNLKNEKTMIRAGSQRHSTKKTDGWYTKHHCEMVLTQETQRYS
jgi:hypothetical protein